jgi:sortase A
MKHFEYALWTIGAVLVLIFAATQVSGEIARRHDIAAFVGAQDQGQTQGLALTESGAAQEIEIPSVPARTSYGANVLAVLRIPGIELELPVIYGTDEQVLRRGAGVIEGTALPGSNGNVAIAAHRDTHFRALKDLALGDQIELEMPDRTQTYVVTELSVVEPTDVQVLAETGAPVLTLVTCYPFYFVGHAPQRFIVRAEAAESSI